VNWGLHWVSGFDSDNRIGDSFLRGIADTFPVKLRCHWTRQAAFLKRSFPLVELSHLTPLGEPASLCQRLQSTKSSLTEACSLEELLGLWDTKSRQHAAGGWTASDTASWFGPHQRQLSQELVSIEEQVGGRSKVHPFTCYPESPMRCQTFFLVARDWRDSSFPLTSRGAGYYKSIHIVWRNYLSIRPLNFIGVYQPEFPTGGGVITLHPGSLKLRFLTCQSARYQQMSKSFGHQRIEALVLNLDPDPDDTCQGSLSHWHFSTSSSP